MEKVARKSAGRVNLPITKKDAAFFTVVILGFFVGRFIVFEVINPVAVGFAANFLGGGAVFTVVSLLALTGLATLVSGSFLLKYIIVFALLVCCHIYLRRRRVMPNIYAKSAAAAVCTLIGGLVLAAAEGMSVYFAFVAVLEAAMTLFVTYILKNGVGVVTGKKRRKLLNGEEVASIALLFGAVIAGMVDIYVGNVALRLFMATFIILTAAYKGGIAFGATVGMLIGLVLFLANYQGAALALIMGFAGLAAGLFRARGKLFSLIGMFAGGLVVTAYIDPALLTQILIFSVCGGALLFMITPDNFYFDLHSTINPTIDNSDEYIRRVKTLTTDRLNAFSDTFAGLARSFSKLSEKRTNHGNSEISILVDNISSTACDACTMREFCWQTNFYATYQAVFGMLDVCEKKGRIDTRDLPEHFMNTCTNIPNFVSVSNRLFEVHKLNLMWNNKIAESRELVAQQLVGVSALIRKLSRDLGLELNFREDIEEAIITELNYSRIEPQRVIVLENKLGKLEISILHQPCYGKKLCRKEVAPIVSRVLGKKIIPFGSGCTTERGLCSLSLREEQQFRMATGVARRVKSGSKESGDSYSVMNMQSGQAILALSDGMGSGKQALAESTAAIELLEDFITSGFEKDMALRMINSALVLKSSEEMFSTLDICSLDLYTGTAEFCKIGAATTYLLRGGSLSTIRSTSLPIGILSNVEPEMHTRKLQSGDIIVMVTDGICSCDASVGRMSDMLASLTSRTPQDIADIITTEAAKHCDDIIKDDMTALVAKVWEK